MKPLILSVEESKVKITNVINGAIQDGVPCYFLESIVGDILVQLRNGKNLELEKARELEKEAEKDDIES